MELVRVVLHQSRKVDLEKKLKAQHRFRILPNTMSIEELEREILLLPDDQRAGLASKLLDSLPAVLVDDDEGVAEALRRDAEMDRDPNASMTIEEFRTALGR